MKKLLCCWVLGVFAATTGLSESIEDLVKRNMNNDPTFPAGNATRFKSVQKEAAAGDVSAQGQLADLLIGHMQAVYAPLQSRGGLVFSVRKPAKGYDDATRNYAVNLEAFFSETTDKVKLKKKAFEVKTKEGLSYSVTSPKYRKKDESIEVKAGVDIVWIPLADLMDADRRFVESALLDQAFSSDLDISIEDARSAGEKDIGNSDYTVEVASTLSRTIILENTGDFPLENLALEYQSFAEQTILKMPKEFSADFRVVGLIKVPMLAPGEKKEFALRLPSTLSQKTQTVTTGDTEWYNPIPSDQNRTGEGRHNGICVRVHRFTPYGERLEREYKSAGTPSLKWNLVAPVNSEIR